MGCGFPAALFLKSRTGGLTVGIAMISRGEVGLIVASFATAAGVVSPSIYSVIVLMVVVTTIIPPVLLKRMAKAPVSIKELPVNYG